MKKTVFFDKLTPLPSAMGGWNEDWHGDRQRNRNKDKYENLEENLDEDWDKNRDKHWDKHHELDPMEKRALIISLSVFASVLGLCLIWAILACAIPLARHRRAKRDLRSVESIRPL